MSEKAPAKPKTPIKRTRPAEGEAGVREKIAAMPGPARAMGERLHDVILDAAPGLKPKVWYGMPGYAKDGPVLCFFRTDDGLMTFGLTEKARHEPEESASHQLMASAWFFRRLDETTEAKIAEIVRRATA